jgi:hypothetical protein
MAFEVGLSLSVANFWRSHGIELSQALAFTIAEAAALWSFGGSLSGRGRGWNQ